MGGGEQAFARKEENAIARTKASPEPETPTRITDAPAATPNPDRPASAIII
jgi:hypothetical protein